MDLADVIKLECCTVDLTAADKDEALKKLADLIVKGNHFEPGSEKDVYNSLKNSRVIGAD